MNEYMLSIDPLSMRFKLLSTYRNDQILNSDGQHNLDWLRVLGHIV